MENDQDWTRRIAVPYITKSGHSYARSKSDELTNETIQKKFNEVGTCFGGTSDCCAFADGVSGGNLNGRKEFRARRINRGATLGRSSILQRRLVGSPVAGRRTSSFFARQS